MTKINVHFKPKKQWYQFWKRERQLTEGKDYSIDNGTLRTNKFLTGEITTTYKYKE